MNSALIGAQSDVDGSKDSNSSVWGGGRRRNVSDEEGIGPSGKRELAYQIEKLYKCTAYLRITYYMT